MGLVAVLTYLRCGMIVWAVNEGLDRGLYAGFCCWEIMFMAWVLLWSWLEKISLSLDNHSHLNHQKKA